MVLHILSNIEALGLVNVTCKTLDVPPNKSSPTHAEEINPTSLSNGAPDTS